MSAVLVNPYIYASGGGAWTNWNGSQDGSTSTIPMRLDSSPVTTSVRLDDTRVLVISAGYTSSPGNTIMKCTVGTLSNTTETWDSGHTADIYTGLAALPSSIVNGILVDTDKVLLLWSSSESQKVVYGVVVSVSGTTPSVGTVQAISSETSNANLDLTAPASTLINTNVVYLNYTVAGGSTKAMIITVSGTSLSVGTPTIILTGSNTASCPSPSYYASGKILVMYIDITNSYPKAFIVNYSGTTIGSTGPVATIESKANEIYSFMSLGIDTNSVIAIYSNSNASGTPRLRATILSLSGNTVSVGNSTTINNSVTYSSWVSKLNSSQFMVTYKKTSPTSALYGAVVTINGSNITSGSEVLVQASTDETLSQNATLNSTKCITTSKVSGQNSYKILKAN